jgi:hypothetical protein
MALFMDIHHIEGGVAMADVEQQDALGVKYLRYWVDEPAGKIFCLVEAPRPTPPTRSTAAPTGWWPTRSSRSARGVSTGRDRA